MAFTEGRILDAEGRVCAHATGTFKYMRREVASSADPLKTD
jgi:acyl-coenzyme A thioesterase PaaI-like protein